jgi:hypothetical protein
LINGLPSADEALFIEQEIESGLRKSDVPVEGELGSERAP